MVRFKKIAVLALLAAGFSLAMAQEKSASIQFVVLKSINGKPVKNAEIILHPVDKHGREESESFELKTHEDGKAEISGLSFGKFRVQVVAHGFRTYGDDYDLRQSTQEITIKLQKPADQYSIYK